MSNLIFNPIVPITFMSIFVTFMLFLIFINRKHLINRIIILILIFIISQRPMIVNQEEVTYSLNLDVIFVVDTTLSMLADDVKNFETRIDLTKDIMKKIVNELAGSRFAIISHNNAAYVKYPFSFDNAAILSVIDSLSVVETHYAAGTLISRPANYLRMLLKSSIITSNSNLANRKKIVVFFGDGEIDNYQNIKRLKELYTIQKYFDYKEDDIEEVASYDGMNELIDNGMILGTGTKTGGKIVARGTLDDKKYAKNGYVINYDTQKPLMSYLNEEGLKDLASKLGIEYMNAESSELKNKIKEIKGMTEENLTNEKVKKSVDTYYYFTFLLTMALIYELYYYRRNEL